jgi:hypothetical protein
LKKTHHKNRAGGVTQGEGPKFKCQHRKKKKEREMAQDFSWAQWMDANAIAEIWEHWKRARFRRK